MSIVSGLIYYVKRQLDMFEPERYKRWRMSMEDMGGDQGIYDAEYDAQRRSMEHGFSTLWKIVWNPRYDQRRSTDMTTMT